MPHSEDNSKPVRHGGDVIATARRLGKAPAELIDMSGNLNPLGPDAALLEHLHGRLAEIAFLPETDSAGLRKAFAAQCGRAADKVMAGSGTTEFIFAIPASLPVERALIVAPTYGDYLTACRWAGIAVDLYLPAADRGFALQLPEIARQLKGNEIVFLCNPNNPTGKLLSSAALHDLIKGHPRSYFVVDESYLPFCDEPSLLSLPQLDNLFILTSFSKVYCIPGLRLGFLTAAADRIEAIAHLRRPWGVNRLAQIAGEYLLQHGTGIKATLHAFLQKERPLFLQRLRALPHTRVLESDVHFFTCRLSGPVDAPHLHGQLLRKAIMIRDCTNFSGLDGSYFRVSMRDSAQNMIFFSTIQAILSSED